MKLTEKDKEFVERLKRVMQDRDLSVTMKNDGVKRFVLRRNYGDKIEKVFGLTRQGIRWRFQRLFGDVYVSAYEAIYWIETAFGTELRGMALEIAKQRVELRRKASRGKAWGRPATAQGRKTR